MAKKLGAGLPRIDDRPASKRVNVMLPHDLRTLMDRRVIDDGYGLKGRSRWIREAVMRLPNYPDYVELITESAPRSGTQIQVVFNGDSLRVLLEAARRVRQEELMREGVFSDVVRASIYQRLLRAAPEVSTRAHL